MLRLLLICCASLALFACATTHPEHPESTEPTGPQAHSNPVRFTKIVPDDGDGPCGWLYAFDRASGEPDACVYVWSPERWSLGLETQPGAYGNIVMEGEIRDGVPHGLPVEVLLEARNLYAAGHVSATLGDQPIRQHR